MSIDFEVTKLKPKGNIQERYSAKCPKCNKRTELIHDNSSETEWFLECKCTPTKKMVVDPTSHQVAQWQEYETQIYKICRSRYARCQVIYNDQVVGKFSKVYRQIDVSIKTRIEGFDIFGVVECKYLNKRVDVKTIDSYLGFLEDIGANFGYIITNNGFSFGAENRADVERMHLQVVKFAEFEKQTIDMDDIINHSINSLVFIKPIFMIRLKHWSSFVDFERSSFEERVIAFKDVIPQGKLISFPHSERNAYKKLMEQTARAFRDFPSLERLKIIIPFAETKQEYFSEIEIRDYEGFLGVKFEDLRKDIKVWRQFLGSITKLDVQKFALKYAKSIAYEPPFL